MGGGCEPSTNTRNSLGLLNETCVYDVAPTDYSTQRSPPSSHNLPRSKEHTIRLPTIEPTGSKRDIIGQSSPKNRGPWGDSKNTKEQPTDAIRFPRICKKWSPPPNHTSVFRRTDNENCENNISLTTTNNTAAVRLSPHIHSDCTMNRSDLTTGPSPNPVLLPISFTDPTNMPEKRLRYKMKRLQSTISEPDDGLSFPALTFRTQPNSNEPR